MSENLKPISGREINKKSMAEYDYRHLASEGVKDTNTYSLSSCDRSAERHVASEEFTVSRGNWA
jgi:hypothetical protein